jgi:hypothetical protein
MLYLTTDYDRMNPVTKERAIADFREFLEQYEKKCHLPLPERSEMIRRSIIEIARNAPVSIINFMREKTKIHLHVPSEMHTNDRFR